MDKTVIIDFKKMDKEIREIKDLARTNISDVEDIFWREDGIHQTISRKNIITNYHLWQWHDFKILARWFNTVTEEVKYDYFYRGVLRQDVTFAGMLKEVAEFSLLKMKGKQLFGRMADLYMKNTKVPQRNYGIVCGFSENGWQLPHEHRFDKIDEFQAPLYDNLKKMGEMQLDLKDAAEKMKLLYKSTTIQNKDILFAIGMIMPFQFALRDHTDLSPHYTFYSHDGGTGKTEASRLITTNWWNSSPGVFEMDAIKSPSRFGSYASAFTFGMVIDDCAELTTKIKPTLKASQTGKTDFIRKTKENTIKFKTEYKVPWIFTMNEFSEMYQDEPYLTRNFILPIERILSNEEKTQYKKALQPNGFFGHAIYQTLKTISLEEVIILYDQQPKLHKASPRANTIFQLLNLGAFFFKEVFGIDLDLDLVPEYISKTVKITHEGLRTSIVALLEKGAHYEKQYREGWMGSEVIKFTYLKKDGFLFTNDHVIDIKKHLNITLTLTDLRKKMIKFFPNRVSTTKSFNLKGKTIKGVFYQEKENPLPEPEGYDVPEGIEGFDEIL